MDDRAIDDKIADDPLPLGAVRSTEQPVAPPLREHIRLQLSHAVDRST